MSEIDRDAPSRRDFLKTTLASSLLPALVTETRASDLNSFALAGETEILKKESDGVILKLPDGFMKIQFFSKNIVRILFSTNNPNPNRDSFARISEPEKTEWKSREDNQNIKLYSHDIEVDINKNTGSIKFLDGKGKLLLAEYPHNARSLTPIKFKEQDTFLIQQKYTLDTNEAFYGLGQHQQGTMNYQGSVVHLEQQNMHVAIPVMLSNKGYGIFWDNPAITDVSIGGNSFEVIPSENLWTDDQPGGLKGTYFNGNDFQTEVGSRIDSEIDFVWSGSSPIKGTGIYNFSVQWTGELVPNITGTYKIQTISDDGCRLWLDDKLLIDDWFNQAATVTNATVELKAGVHYNIKVQYFQDGGGSSMQLNWSLPEANPSLSWKSNVGEMIDYYFMVGPELDEVIAAYRKLTGAVPMFGKWSWGFWQCKNRYETQEEILGVASEYRSMDIPIDGIIQDWMYWDPYPWGSNRFNPLRYPDPHGMIAELHKMKVHFMISVWAKFQPGSSNYALLAAAGVLYPSPCTDRFYDPFNPLGRKLYWQCMNRELFDLGVDGWWLDASEPELCSNWGEFANIKTYAGYGAFVYNAYPLMHTKAVHDGQRSTSNSKRVMILTRSAWAGQQRNGAITWSGDVNGDWGTFARQIPAGINFAMSGIPYWNTDIGGYISGNPQDPAYAELFVRWFQFGSFCPLFRVHGVNYGKEMWKFGAEKMAILVKFNHLRYLLLPYIYSVAWMVTSQGYTMLRGLVMDFRLDKEVYSIPDQFMFGPALMICPVTTQDATERSVYLPHGEGWFDFWTGEKHGGATRVTAQCPLNSMPIYVKAGSIIPMGTLVQNAEED